MPKNNFLLLNCEYFDLKATVDSNFGGRADLKSVVDIDFSALLVGINSNWGESGVFIWSEISSGRVVL